MSQFSDRTLHDLEKAALKNAKNLQNEIAAHVSQKAYLSIKS